VHMVDMMRLLSTSASTGEIGLILQREAGGWITTPADVPERERERDEICGHFPRSKQSPMSVAC
jgi:hypothetical protein